MGVYSTLDSSRLGRPRPSSATAVPILFEPKTTRKVVVGGIRLAWRGPLFRPSATFSRVGQKGRCWGCR